jgi:hypothetical protein
MFVQSRTLASIHNPKHVSSHFHRSGDLKSHTQSKARQFTFPPQWRSQISHTNKSTSITFPPQWRSQILYTTQSTSIHISTAVEISDLIHNPKHFNSHFHRSGDLRSHTQSKASQFTFPPQWRSQISYTIMRHK